MSWWLYSFIASGALLLFSVALKMVQNYFGVLLFWPEARDRLERRVRARTLKIDKGLQEFSTKNVYIILHFFVAKLKGVLVVLHSWLDRKSYRLVSLIRGRQHLEGKGKASYFLSDVASFRDRFRKR